MDHQVMGSEYVGVVEEVGAGVPTMRPGAFVVGSFVISANTRDICRAGFHSTCAHAQFVSQIGTQGQRARIPRADGAPGWLFRPGRSTPDRGR